MRIRIIMLLAVMAWEMQAQPYQTYFEEGNAAYRKENYKQAIQSYQQILEKGQESAPLYFNLGNAYFKTGQLGESILNYERALTLAPGDEEILQNRSMALEKTVDRFDKMPQPLFQTVYRQVLTFLSPSGWAACSLVCFALLAAGTGLYLFSPQRRMGFVSGLIGLVLGMTTLSLAYTHQSYQKSHQKAVVMEPSSYVKSGPSDSAEDVLILHEGTRATVLDRLDDWNKIRLPDGKLGWIRQGDIAKV